MDVLLNNITVLTSIQIDTTIYNFIFIILYLFVLILVIGKCLRRQHKLFTYLIQLIIII